MKTIICILLVIILVGVVCSFPAFCAAPWPDDSDWIAYVDTNWDPIQDVTGDESPTAVDIAGVGQGSFNSVWIYYSSAYQTIYVRMLLSGDPHAKGGSAPYKQYVWAVVFETTQDEYLDWALVMDGMAGPSYGGDAVMVWYNATPGQDQVPDVVNWFVSAEPTQGYTRVSSAGFNTVGKEMFYLDWQASLNVFSSTDSGAPPPLSESTPLRLFYATGASDNQFNKDTMTGAEINFTNVATTTLGGIESGRYGVLYDTRDTPPLGDNDGIWYRGETVYVKGYGWPYSSLTLNVRVLAPDASTVVWFGTVPSATGRVDPSPTWPILCFAVAGIYYIQVEDPFNSGTWYTYDRFTAEAPDVAITKSASPDTVSSGGNITYAIEVTNMGTISANVISIVDVIPTTFTYISNTTVMNAASGANPTINGDILTWSGNWIISPGSSLSLTFEVSVGTQRGIFYNNASAYGTNFCPASTGNTAPINVLCPELSLVKNVNKSSAAPGEVITYTLTYENIGDEKATDILILETIPTYTTYVTGSVTSSFPITTEFSHDGGLNFDFSDTPPVTHILWSRTNLLPGSEDTTGFQVVID